MENKYLKDLRNLISALNKSEIELARKHLVAYQSNHTIHSKKMFQVYSEILKNKSIVFDKLKQKISPEINNPSFNRLLERTLGRVQESLIIDVNINREGAYSELFRKRYQVKKIILQAQILNSKGLVNRTLKLYNRIIKNSIKFELYDELIETLYLKLVMASDRDKNLNYHNIKDEIRKYEIERANLIKARFVMNDYTYQSNLESNTEEQIKFLSSNLKELNYCLSNVESSNTLSIIYLLQIEYCMLLGEVSTLIFVGEKLLRLLNEKIAIKSFARVIYVNNEISEAYILKYDFELAMKYSLETKKLIGFRYNSIFLSIQDSFVRIKIYQNEIIGLIEYLKEILSLDVIKKFKIKQSRFIFYQSVINFRFKQFKDSFKLLDELKLIEKDKEGWNIWIRIMRILCSIELLRLNLVDYDIESFRKYIQRISKEGNINPRIELILKILVELDRTNYDFEEVAQKRRAELANLKKTTGKYKWDIKSPEMILFHNWFEAKLNNQTYEPNLEPYRVQVAKDEAKPLSKAKEKKFRALGLID